MKPIGSLIFLFLCMSVVVYSQEYSLFGTVTGGGPYNNGLIFKTDTNTENFNIISVLKSDHSGAYPAGVICEAKNGKFYGSTTWGGINNLGVLFEWDPVTEIFIDKLSFNSETGVEPYGSLIEIGNNKLIGLTTSGGLYNSGTIFEWDYATNTFIKKFDFDNNNHGRYPLTLTKPYNKKLYGTTAGGGLYDAGVLYEWDLEAGSYKKLFDFEKNLTGWIPYGTVVASNGTIYGMTMQGGEYNYGVLYEYNLFDSSYTKILDFNNENGREPRSILIEADTGKLYGTTRIGGVYNFGVLFEFDIAGKTFTKILDFNGIDKGKNPGGQFFLTQSGNLIGITERGGSQDRGVLYEFAPDDSIFVKKLDFVPSADCLPQPFLIESGNKLYGLERAYDIDYITGILFEWDSASNIYTEKFQFNEAENGRTPTGALVQAENGKLYGTTNLGGRTNEGVIFELDPSDGSLTKKYDFTGSDNGGWPSGSLTLASNGKLYGTASAGGSYSNSDYGVVFEWDPITSIFTKKIDFNGEENGRFPNGSMVEADNGKLYGLTYDGGIYTHHTPSREEGNGVLYEWDPITDVFTKKMDFADTLTGRNPSGSLIKANNGKLYGHTSSGGRYQCGVLFEWHPDSNTFRKLFDFNDSVYGCSPSGALLQADDNKLYGVAGGGVFNFGVLFEWDIEACKFTKLLDFTGNGSGSYPYGNLIQGSNTKLYGMTWYGGTDNKGVLFEWDISDSSYNVKIDFGKKTNSSSMRQFAQLQSRSRGKFDTEETVNLYGSLSKIREKGGSAISIVTDSACLSYRSASGKIYSASGTYMDTIPGILGSDSIIELHLKVITIDTSVTLNQEQLASNESDASYQWISGNNNSYVLIPGEINKTFSCTESGNYAVVVYKNGCTDTSQFYSITKLRIEPISNQFIVYPNPTSDRVFIDPGTENPEGEIVITEMDGRIIQKLVFTNSQQIVLQLSAGPGLYLMIITTKSKRVSYTIVKQ